MYYILHHCKGTPFATPYQTSDQGRHRRLTLWEQIDDGLQNTNTRKFYTIVSILLYILAQFYSKFDAQHVPLNVVALGISLLPKLSFFHRFRLLDINRY